MSGRSSDKAWRAPSARRVRAIRDRLREVYGIPRARPHGDPLAELILTVLSQSTNDRNRDVAYLALRERFPTWEQVRDADVDLVEEAIRPGGISKVKSARIKAILRAISDEPPRVRAASGSRPNTSGSNPDASGSSPDASAMSLAPLSSMGVPDAQRYLCSLPGVGRKTAACVLLFSFGMRDVPVDTHVSRVATRLGLLRPGASFTEQHDQMLALTPPGQELELHLNLLRHGRRCCHARSPECGICALARMCPSARLFGPAGHSAASPPA